MIEILLCVVAGHNVGYWLYRIQKAVIPGVRMLWALRVSGRRPIPYTPTELGSFWMTLEQHSPGALVGLEESVRTDLSKFTTDDEHQSVGTPPPAPVVPVDSAVQPGPVPPAAVG